MSGFISMFKIITPYFILPGRHAIRNDIILYYNDIKIKIIKELKTIKSFGITTDAWTSKQNKSYITTTVNYIDEKWNMKSYVLQTRE